MIPKIAHFHWDGPPMSWLRIVSISTFAKLNPSWEIRLIRSHPSTEGRGLSYAQKADQSWWIALEKDGGFQIATDIVFLKPIPDDWLDAELCANTNGSKGVFQFAMLGCVPSHPFISKVVEEGSRRVREMVNMDYQSLGVMLLQEMSAWMGTTKELPMSALCHYDHNQCERLWDPYHVIDLPEDAIGVHWYGGHTLSLRCERDAGPNSAYPLTKLASSVFP